MAKLYRLAPRRDLVLLDERGKTAPQACFILDNHPAFAGQGHKLIACDPATLAEGELTPETLLGRLGDVERSADAATGGGATGVAANDRAQRPARARA